MKSAAFFAYANNYLIDVKFGIIMDVEAQSLQKSIATATHCSSSIASPA
jgi:hypothetical protein